MCRYVLTDPKYREIKIAANRIVPGLDFRTRRLSSMQIAGSSPAKLRSSSEHHIRTRSPLHELPLCRQPHHTPSHSRNVSAIFSHNSCGPGGQKGAPDRLIFW